MGANDDIERQETNSPNISPQNLEKNAPIDTVHNDEALRVLATYAGDETWTEQEERQLVKKLDRRVLPLLILTYGLQYYDKAMLSQAVCMNKHLGKCYQLTMTRPFSD